MILNFNRKYEKKLVEIADKTGLFPTNWDSYKRSKVSVKEIYDINIIRASDPNSPMCGFEDLLTNLQGEGDKMILLHGLSFNGKYIIVYTEKQMKEIIGILRPKL